METKGRYTIEALEYIAKFADGGLRDAISLMDKCLAYSNQLTLENAIAALGTTDYDTMFDLASNIVKFNSYDAVEIVENIHNAGKDVKQFVKQFTHFLIDLQKYDIMRDDGWKYMQIPRLESYEKQLSWFMEDDRFPDLLALLDVFVKLNNDIKYSSVPKYDVEAAIMLFGKGTVE